MVRDRDAREFIAKSKRPNLNACDAVRDCVMIGQTARCIKYFFSLFVDQDALPTNGKGWILLRNDYFLNPGKCPIPNACDAVGDRDAREEFTAAKRPIPNACDAVGDRDVCEGFTHAKRTLPNACDAVGDRDVREFFAAEKRLISNACDAVGDRDARERSTPAKRLIPNVGDSVRDNAVRHGFILDTGHCFAIIAQDQAVFFSLRFYVITTCTEYKCQRNADRREQKKFPLFHFFYLIFCLICQYKIKFLYCTTHAQQNQAHKSIIYPKKSKRWNSGKKKERLLLTFFEVLELPVFIHKNDR